MTLSVTELNVLCNEEPTPDHSEKAQRRAIWAHKSFDGGIQVNKAESCLMWCHYKKPSLICKVLSRVRAKCWRSQRSSIQSFWSPLDFEARTPWKPTFLYEKHIGLQIQNFYTFQRMKDNILIKKQQQQKKTGSMQFLTIRLTHHFTLMKYLELDLQKHTETFKPDQEMQGTQSMFKTRNENTKCIKSIWGWRTEAERMVPVLFSVSLTSSW